MYRFVHVHSYKFTEKLGCEVSVMIHGEMVSAAIDCSFLTSTWQALSSTDTFDWHYGNWVFVSMYVRISVHVSREGLAANSIWLFIDIHQNNFMKSWPYDVIVLQISLCISIYKNIINAVMISTNHCQVLVQSALANVSVCVWVDVFVVQIPHSSVTHTAPRGWINYCVVKSWLLQSCNIMSKMSYPTECIWYMLPVTFMQRDEAVVTEKCDAGDGAVLTAVSILRSLLTAIHLFHTLDGKA